VRFHRFLSDENVAEMAGLKWAVASGEWVAA
jgi:hypothetical protein